MGLSSNFVLDVENADLAQKLMTLNFFPRQKLDQRGPSGPEGGFWEAARFDLAGG